MGLQSLLSQFSEVVEERDGYVVVCPSHPDSRPSLRVTTGDNGSVLLHCRAGCSTQAVLQDLNLTFADLRQAGNVDGTEAKRSTSKTADPDIAAVAALRVYVAATRDRLQGTTPDAEQAAEYLQSRFGIDRTTARSLDLGVDPGGTTFDLDYLGSPYRRVPRVTVPFRDFDGVARGLQARDLSGHDPVRWCGLTNPTGAAWSKVAVFRLDTGLDNLIITEGPGDALTAVGVGYDAIAIRGAALVQNDSTIAELVRHLLGRRVVIAGDNDNAGKKFNEALSARLAEHGIDAQLLALPDGINDLTEWRKDAPALFADRLHAAVREASTNVATPAPVAPEPEPEPHAEQHIPCTDLGNAERLLNALDGNVRYAPEVGFYLYDGVVWAADRQDRVRGVAHSVTRQMVTDGRRLAQEASNDEEREDGQRLAAWGLRSQSTRHIDAMIRELSAMPGVVIEVSELDQHHHLLAVRNGVVNLKTGELLPHNRELLLTRSIGLPYDPAATCARWEQFLREVFPGHPDLPAYMQRLTGYGITGETAEQCFAVLWGTGSNGKSVFTDTLTSVFRDITVTTPFSTFEEKPSGGIPNDIAALKGARLVMASEGDRGRPMAEALIKRITGRDRISARFMRREFFEFSPTFLILLATNFKPAFRGQDEGLWRRVKLIPWERYFAAHERDHYLGERLMEESAGILTWAVKGAVEWYTNGLGDPPTVVDATKQYREGSDALQGFFPGVLVPEDGSKVSGNDAFRAYQDWCDDEALPMRERWTRRTFYAALEERGVERTTNRLGAVLENVRLRKTTDHHEEQAAPEIPAIGKGDNPKPTLGSIFGGQQ